MSIKRSEQVRHWQQTVKGREKQFRNDHSVKAIERKRRFADAQRARLRDRKAP
jgi:hypothetical protein